MLRNLRMIIAYDGSEFHGWQRQPGMRTVQSEFEQAVRRVARHQVVIIGAGRTDAGVHARGQVANFYTTTDIPAINFFRAIGARLPKDVTLNHVREVPLNFHASRSAVKKLYRYRLFASPRRPVGMHVQRYSYHFWHPLDLDRMRAAGRFCVGVHDFTAMASRGNVRLSNVREVTRCDVFRHGDEIRVDIEGTGFLYNQVRNMVGTLLEIGRGRWPPEQMAAIIAGMDRTAGGPTAPARGLSLEWVLYDLPALYFEEGRHATHVHVGDVEQPRDPSAPVMPTGTDTEEEPGG